MCTALRLFSTQKLTVRQNVMQKRASVFRTLSHFYTEKKTMIIICYSNIGCLWHLNHHMSQGVKNDLCSCETLPSPIMRPIEVT